MNDLIVKNVWDFIPQKVGRWWDRKDTEIDIVALDEESGNIIFGECKYINSPMDIDVYYDLLEKTKKVDWNRSERNEYFVFFSINGYTDKLQRLAEDKRNIYLF